MFDYIDSGILIIVGSILLSLLFMKILFRFVSMPKFLKILIVVIAIVGNGYLIYDYINENESGIINQKHQYYVQGVVLRSTPSINKFKININNKNVKIESDDSTMVVEVNSSTAIRKQKNGEYLAITLDDLKQGDIVSVYFDKSSLGKDDKEIKATKIVVTSD